MKIANNSLYKFTLLLAAITLSLAIIKSGTVFSVNAWDCTWGSCDNYGWTGPSAGCWEFGTCCDTDGYCGSAAGRCQCGGGSGGPPPDSPPVCSSVTLIAKTGCANYPSGVDLGYPNKISSTNHPQCGTVNQGNFNGCMTNMNSGDAFIDGNAAFDVSYPDASSVRLSVHGIGSDFNYRLPGGKGSGLDCSGSVYYWNGLFSQCGGGTEAGGMGCGCDDAPPNGFGCRQCSPPGVGTPYIHQMLNGSGNMPASQSEGNSNPPTKSVSYSASDFPYKASNGPLATAYLLDVKDFNLPSNGIAEVCGSSCVIITGNGTNFTIPGSSGFTISISYTNNAPVAGSGFTVYHVQPMYSPSTTCGGANSLSVIAPGSAKVIVNAYDKGTNAGWATGVATGGAAFHNSTVIGPVFVGNPATPANPSSTTLITTICPDPNNPNTTTPQCVLNNSGVLYTEVTDLGGHTTACPVVNYCGGPATVTISGTMFADTNGNGAIDTGESPVTPFFVRLQDLTTNTHVDFSTSATYTFTANTTDSYALVAPVMSGYASELCFDGSSPYNSYGPPTGSGCYLGVLPVNKVVNIGLSNNIPWLNTFDGDVYVGDSIGGINIKIPPDSNFSGSGPFTNWLINASVATAPKAGGAALSTGPIITDQLSSPYPDHTSIRGTGNPCGTDNPPIGVIGTGPQFCSGWQLSGYTSSGLSYIDKIFSSFNTNATSFYSIALGGPPWNLKKNQSYYMTIPGSMDITPTTTYAVTDSNNIPGGVATLFIDGGNVTISHDLLSSAPISQGLVIIVKGNVTITTANEVDAVIIATGTITAQGNNPQTSILTIKGGLYAKGDINLKARNLTNTAPTSPNNLTSPSVQTILQPVYLTNANTDLVTNKYQWSEVTPNAPPAVPLSFSLGGPNPSSGTVTQSSSTALPTVSIQVTVNSGSGNLTFTASDNSSGITYSLSPTCFVSSTTNCSVTITPTVAANAPTGLRTITITGTSGSNTATTTYTLTVNPAPLTFTLSTPSPTSGAITQGSTVANITQVLLTINSGSGTITFSASDPTTGITYSFNPASCSTNCSPYMTAVANNTTAVGPPARTVTITGTAPGPITSNTTFSLTVNFNPSYNLAGYWPMDENSGTTTADLSGNGSTGTFTNTPTWTTGKYNSGTSYSGSAYINVPDNNSLSPGGTAMTISAWVWESAANTNAAIVSKDTDWSSGREYFLWLDGSNRPTFNVSQNGADMPGISATSSLGLSGWHMITGILNANNLTIWIDGVQSGGSAAWSGTETNTTTALNFGRRNTAISGNYAQFTGKIDDVRIYNRALSGPEVAALAGYTPPNTLLNGLVNYWKMDDTSFADSIGGNNGTGLGGVTVSAGKIGNGGSFNGTTSRVSLNNVIKQNTFTISAWINPTTFGQNDAGNGIFYQGTGNNDLGTSLWVANLSGGAGTNTFGARYEAGNYSKAQDYSLTAGTNTWQHVVFTYSAGTTNFYVNAVNKGGPFTGGLSVAPSTNPAAIGYWYSSADPNRFFQGGIDEVGVWNRVLTTTEISSLYNGGTGRSYPF